jgi:hypothetical protein
MGLIEHAVAKSEVKLFSPSKKGGGEKAMAFNAADPGIPPYWSAPGRQPAMVRRNAGRCETPLQ